jgi:hypothetical protein
MDNSSFPIVTAESSDIMVSGNITIGNKVYTFPNDFTYNSTLHVERNAITGDGIVTAHKVFTFINLPGKPTLDSWLVTRISGYIFDPVTGAPVNPANMHSSGEFKLTGTGALSNVDGFGLEQDDHHDGFIKSWP